MWSPLAVLRITAVVHKYSLLDLQDLLALTPTTALLQTDDLHPGDVGLVLSKDYLFFGLFLRCAVERQEQQKKAAKKIQRRSKRRNLVENEYTSHEGKGRDMGGTVVSPEQWSSFSCFPLSYPPFFSICFGKAFFCHCNPESYVQFTKALGLMGSAVWVIFRLLGVTHTLFSIYRHRLYVFLFLNMPNRSRHRLLNPPNCQKSKRKGKKEGGEKVGGHILTSSHTNTHTGSIQVHILEHPNPPYSSRNTP